MVRSQTRSSSAISFTRACGEPGGLNHDGSPLRLAAPDGRPSPAPENRHDLSEARRDHSAGEKRRISALLRGGTCCHIAITYSHPVTNNAPTPPRKRPPPLSAAERQQRYRACRSLVSIDISGTTSTLIQGLRNRAGLTTDQVLARALDLLLADLDRPAPPPKRRGLRCQPSAATILRSGPPAPSDSSAKTKAMPLPALKSSPGDSSAAVDRPTRSRSSPPAGGGGGQRPSPKGEDQQKDLFAPGETPFRFKAATRHRSG